MLQQVLEAALQQADVPVLFLAQMPELSVDLPPATQAEEAAGGAGAAADSLFQSWINSCSIMVELPQQDSDYIWLRRRRR